MTSSLHVPTVRSAHPSLARRAATARLAGLAGAALGLGTVSLPSMGQGAYPEKPIRLIAPFGGAVDTLARLIALQLAQNLNGNVIVDAKVGGSGAIGMAAIANAAPDGYTIGMGTSTSLTSAPHLIKNPGYDVARSFTYLGLVQTSCQVMVVSPQLGVNTVQEFIALARSKPGEFNFGSSGMGGSIHLVAEEFNAGAGINAVHIPYKTGPETDAAIMAGRVQYAFSALPTSIALIQAGRLKALAVTGDARDPSLPQVVSIKEVNFPALLPAQLYGMVAPANLPPAIAARLSRAIQEISADPSFQDSVRRGGAAPSQVGGDEFRKIVLRDSQQWAGLIKRLGITPN